MVGLGGLEPPTSPLSGARSSHLSYRPLELEWRLETTSAVYDGSAKSAIAPRFWLKITIRFERPNDRMAIQSPHLSPYGNVQTPPPNTQTILRSGRGH